MINVSAEERCHNKDVTMRISTLSRSGFAPVSAVRIVLLVATLACSACSSSPKARAERGEKRNEQIIALLTQKADADSVAAAGLMSFFKNQPESLALLARASTLAPDRPDLLWLQSLLCAQTAACKPEPIEHWLHELDPTNGAGWWGALARATAANDAQGVSAALTAMGHSEHFDIYWTTLTSHLSRAVAATRKISLADSELSIIGYVSALALPPYQTITNACKSERLQQSGILDACRGVAKALQNGDTYITEMIGVAVAKRLWPENSPEWQAAVEERRVYEYRSKFDPKVTLRMAIHPKEYLTLASQNRREQDFVAAQLRAAGKDPNPPAL
jgi:hypothetical protein